MPQLKLYLFGPPRLHLDGQTIEINLRKALALLVYLAVTRQPHSRDVLATLFWPDSDQRRARTSLRRALHQINQRLPEMLAVTPETIAFQPQAELWLDIEAYRQHTAACLPQSDIAAELSPDCLAHLTEAAALYTADFLAGFTLPDCPDFDEWQFFQTESLRRSLTQVLAHLVRLHQAQAEFEPAIAYARCWLSLDPLHEPAQRQLMQLYDQAGQPTAALRQYQAYTQLLDEALGLPPAEETVTLYEAIKARHLLSPFIKQKTERAEEQKPAAKDDRGVEENAEPQPGEDLPSTSTFYPHPQPETQYVRSGEVHIAYQVLGEGPVDVVVIGGFVSHLEQTWEEPDFARFTRRLASFSRLILFDKRGVGLSDRVGYPPSLEHTMDDALAVMEAAGSKKAVLFGVSQGGPNSALMAATYPERVLGLILYGTLARWLHSADYPWGWTREHSDATIKRYETRWGGPVRLEYFAPSRTRDEAFRHWWARLLRLASSPGGIREVLEVSREIDVRHILPAIQVPALVLHRTGDKIIPLEAGRYMANLIPSAKFIELPGQDHFWWLGDSEAILAEIEQFLNALKPPTPFDRMLATILYAEISDTAAQEQGQDQSRSRLAGYKTGVRNEIARFRGREIEQSGRHVLAAFDGPSRAIGCAAALRSLAQAHNLTLRSGLHCGECEAGEGGLKGAAVDIAAGVMAKAAPGEILVSNTVKDLVVGSGFPFEPRGAYQFRDIADEWRLFALKS